MSDSAQPPPPRGFGALPEEVRIELARRGGQAAQSSPKARRWDSESARQAGRKGAAANRAKRERGQGGQRG